MVDLLFQYRLEDGSNLQIGSDLFQMKRAVDILKLECKCSLLKTQYNHHLHNVTAQIIVIIAF